MCKLEQNNGFLAAVMRLKRAGARLAHGGPARIGELMMLRYIQRKTSEGVSTIDLARELHMTKPAVSQNLKTLEAHGYITRKMDTDDRRKIRVVLTECGESVLEERKAHAENLMRVFQKEMGAQRLSEATELFNVMADIVEKLMEQAPQGEGEVGE